jgi:hypothetical protein
MVYPEFTLLESLGTMHCYFMFSYLKFGVTNVFPVRQLHMISSGERCSLTAIYDVADF